MRLKLFRASGMAEAMARVRAELGGEALILATRRVAEGVEITAALEPEAEEIAPEPLRAAPASDLAGTLAFHAVPSSLRAALLSGALEPALERVLRFGALALTRPARPLLFAGPPGAGKTLTVARLATRLVMAGTLPMVACADGLRAGGAEQLAAFTRLLGIELLMAGHPVVLSHALARRPQGSPVLIDAPGCDPFDPDALDDLAALAGTADAEIVLVLPAGLDPNEAADLATGFAAAGARHLVATRLDQARRLGGVIAAAHAAGLCLTEAGIGPGAADGLVPLTPAFLAARLQITPQPRPMPGAVG